MQNRLKHYREIAGLTLEDASERTGMSLSQISRIERGKSDISGRVLQLFATLYDVEPADLIDSGRSTLGRLKVRGHVQAGEWREALEWPEEEWYTIGVPQSSFNGRRFGLEVRGPSMNEVYPEGSIVDCVSFNETGLDPKTGQHVVVYRQNEMGEIEATVKELRIADDDQIWLWPRSHHPDFQAPVKFDETTSDVTIAALVIGSYTKAHVT